jgi:hypothetical protein
MRTLTHDSSKVIKAVVEMITCDLFGRTLYHGHNISDYRLKVNDLFTGSRLIICPCFQAIGWTLKPRAGLMALRSPGPPPPGNGEFHRRYASSVESEEGLELGLGVAVGDPIVAVCGSTASV